MATITNEQKQLITDLLDKGYSPTLIAEKLGISKRTVQRHKKSSTATEATAEDNQVNNNNYTTKVADLSRDLEKAKQLAQIDKTKHRWYSFIVYLDSAPSNWREILCNTGLPIAISPLHNQDVYLADSEAVIDEVTGAILQEKGALYKKGDLKKPHWHVIIDFGKSVPYKQVRDICDLIKSPRPMWVQAPCQMFQYLTHANESENSEKYVYSEPAQQYNGFTLPVDDSEKAVIRSEIRLLIYVDDITEYGRLVSKCHQLSQPHVDLVRKEVYYFDRLLASYRADPVCSLKEVFNELADNPEKQEKVQKKLEKYLCKGDN